jgi:hypothetical protein
VILLPRRPGNPPPRISRLAIAATERHRRGFGPNAFLVERHGDEGLDDPQPA